MVRISATSLVLGAVLAAGCGEFSPAEAPGGFCPATGAAGPFHQGQVTETGVWSDVALLGDGFLVLQADDSGGEVYSRDGRLELDWGGTLRGAGGLPVKIFAADGQEPVAATVSWWAPPQATQWVEFRLNLDAETELQGFDPGNPECTSSFSTTARVLDSLGAEHAVQVFFTKVASREWRWNAMLDGSELVGATAGTRHVIAAGTLHFDAMGRLLAQTQTFQNFCPRDAIVPQDLRFNFGDDLTSGGTGLFGATQFASVSSATWIGHDGLGVGITTGVAFDVHGALTLTYHDGRKASVGQLAVARFERPEQLTPSGAHPFSAVPACAGERSLVIAPADGTLYVWPGALEDLGGTP